MKIIDFCDNWKRNKRQQNINSILGEVDEDLDNWMIQYKDFVKEEYSILNHERRIIITIPIGKLK